MPANALHNPSRHGRKHKTKERCKCQRREQARGKIVATANASPNDVSSSSVLRRFAEHFCIFASRRCNFLMCPILCLHSVMLCVPVQGNETSIGAQLGMLYGRQI